MNFNEKAIMWDDEYRINRAKVLAKTMMDKLEPSKAERVMEFGCGTGLLSCCLADEFKEIYCVDTSEKMIEVLGEKLKALSLSNTKTACRDLLNEAEPFLPEYDLIFTSMALHHIKETEKVIGIFHRLLNKGGRLAIIDLNSDDGSFHKEEKDFEGHHGYSREELQKIIGEAGFSEISIETIFEDERLIQGEKVPYSLFLCTARK